MYKLLVIYLLIVSYHANAQFQISYKAGQIDARGNFIGGTEMRLLCQHKGKLFGGIETWMDTIAAGSTDPYIGAQILRLDAGDGPWQLDHHFDSIRTIPRAGARTLFRNEGVTSLKSVIFLFDSLGNLLPQPDTILLAACRDFNGVASVYTRMDSNGKWTETQIAPAITAKATIRSFAAYRDKVTNADMVFAGCLPQGLIAGVYDQSLPGKIRWLPAEITSDTANIGLAGSGSWQGRPMAFTECNGSLFCAAAPIILKRIDGRAPSWQEVVRYPLVVTPGGSSGLRGLTAVRNPSGSGQALIAALEGGSCAVARATPSISLPFSSATEQDIMTDLTTAWITIPPTITASYVVAANSEMTAVVDPVNGDTCHIITIQHHPAAARDDAFYYVRRQTDSGVNYQLMRIDNARLSVPIVLNSTRACQISPFVADSGKYIFFGGYDADNNWTHNAAYVLRTTVKNALGYGEFAGIDNVTDEVGNGLIIYPNPAQEYLTIEPLIDDWDTSQITISDLTGRVLSTQTKQRAGKTQIAVSEIPKGIYILTIAQATGRRFVKKITIN